MSYAVRLALGSPLKILALDDGDEFAVAIGIHHACGVNRSWHCALQSRGGQIQQVINVERVGPGWRRTNQSRRVSSEP